MIDVGILRMSVMYKTMFIDEGAHAFDLPVQWPKMARITGS